MVAAESGERVVDADRGGRGHRAGEDAVAPADAAKAHVRPAEGGLRGRVAPVP